MNIHLSTPIEKLTRVGKVTSDRLAKLGIESAKDLLEHYPARFEDYSEKLSINQLAEGQTGSIFGAIKQIESKKTPRKRIRLTEARLDDGTGTIKIIWFNQPYITQTIRQSDQIAIAGKIERDFDGWVIKNPNFEKVSADFETIHTARLVPIYPSTAGITQKQIRFLIQQALEAVDEYTEILPKKIIQQGKLIGKKDAIKSIHLPKSESEYLKASRRLKFEELFIIQLVCEMSREKLAMSRAPKIEFNKEATKNLVANLAFDLTDDQRKATWKILQDLSKDTPMNRLLQGEVGSGKTVVAAIASLNAAESGFETAIMAPTEILAFQHYQTITNIFPERPIALLTSKHARMSGDEQASRSVIKNAITNGKVDIVIGTHAIIQNNVIFNKLGLIVIDEQHRFGVEQRKTLKDKSPKDVPHLLSMTATPIPRSLALTLYGDLDITTIRQMPKGRKKILTRVVEEENRAKAYQFIRKKISEGRQVFVICPLIEESDILGVKSATQEYEKLKKQVFPEIKISLVHGKLKPDEKEKTMKSFKNNETKMLVATAVVEVGVDIPNASIMIIEGSDRFGLSQLHQFRGRVGRSEHQSYCFLFTDSRSDQTKKRLNAFVSAKDGFEISELDLQLRGPGQIYGTMQSGYFNDLKIAALSDSELISEAKERARHILKDKANLDEYPLLKFELEKRSHSLHFE